MKLFSLIPLVVAVGACSGSDADTEENQSVPGYIYGNLLTAEEVRADPNDIVEVTTARFAQMHRGLKYNLAITAQVSGDGIMCDLLMTQVVMELFPNKDFMIAAQEAQSECLNFGIQASQMSSQQ